MKGNRLDGSRLGRCYCQLLMSTGGGCCQISLQIHELGCLGLTCLVTSCANGEVWAHSELEVTVALGPV